MRGPVEQVRDTGRLSARDRDQLPALHAAARRDARGPVRLHRRPGERDQIDRIATVERQRENALVPHDLPEAGIARLDERRRRLHLHGLFHRAERQFDVDHRRVADLQHETGAHVRLEAGKVHVQPIRPDRQIGQRVRTIRIGDGRPFQAGGGLRRGDVGPRQHAAARVLHDAGDLCRRSGLRMHQHARKQNRERAAGDIAQDALHQTS